MITTIKLTATAFLSILVGGIIGTTLKDMRPQKIDLIGSVEHTSMQTVESPEIIWTAEPEPEPEPEPYMIVQNGSPRLDVDRLIADYGKPVPIVSFFLALWHQESGLRLDAPMGDGDNVGRCFQIRPAYMEDAGWSTILYPQDELSIVYAYMCRYARPQFAALLGAETWPIEDLARIHNGGPHGHAKTATIAYGESVVRLAAEYREKESDAGIDLPEHLRPRLTLTELSYEMGRLDYQ